MKILLDTNALIWWLEDEPMLGPRARALLANPAHAILATIVSLWEITIKWRIGKYPMPGSAFATFIEQAGIGLIPVTPAHLAALESLAFHHKDPFDHLIIAQSIVEGAGVVTSDAVFADYGVRCFPAGN